MADTADCIDIYIEAGAKKTVASALDYPGWCRTGPDEALAVQALYDCGPRYARVLRLARVPFHAPAAPSALVMRERLTGNAATDMGVPTLAPQQDALPVDAADLARLVKILKACWRSFDAAANAAEDKTLRLGPRGGGRDLRKILTHVLEAEAAYLDRLGWKHKPDLDEDLRQELERERKAVLTALQAAVRGELPACGPRGGLHWSPRYFIRRSAYHVLDHAWEIEDRTT